MSLNWPPPVPLEAPPVQEPPPKLNWRDITLEQPADGQKCLTLMKHGMISGEYDAQSNGFGGYYWRDMEWYAQLWVPYEEAQ
jgi:hypothetical protein